MVGYDHQSQDQIVRLDRLGRTNEILATNELPGRTMTGRGERQRIHLASVEWESEPQFHRRGARLALEDDSRPPYSEEIRDRDQQRGAGPEVAIAPIEDHRYPLFCGSRRWTRQSS